MKGEKCFLVISQLFNQKPTYSIFEEYKDAYGRMETEYRERVKNAMEMMEFEIHGD